jgi:hypothetical protein
VIDPVAVPGGGGRIFGEFSRLKPCEWITSLAPYDALYPQAYRMKKAEKKRFQINEERQSGFAADRDHNAALITLR